MENINQTKTLNIFDSNGQPTKKPRVQSVNKRFGFKKIPAFKFS